MVDIYIYLYEPYADLQVQGILLDNRAKVKRSWQPSEQQQELL